MATTPSIEARTPRGIQHTLENFVIETENITPPWSYGNFIGFCNKVMEPLYECRDNYDWISELAERLGLGECGFVPCGTAKVIRLRENG